MRAGGGFGTVGASQNHKLTVDFHEGEFASSVSKENSLMLQQGFWGDDVDPSGPANPQALNRYESSSTFQLGTLDPQLEM